MLSDTDILYLSHGAGPMPLLDDEAHRELVEQLQAVSSRIKKPDAILLVSAHWEETTAHITAAPQPDLIYDYYGFPDESYDIQYPAAGEPVFAQAIATALNNHDIPVELDTKRGFDHGMFVPLKIMYPEADIPCVQLSLLNNLDAEQHLAIGEALRDLKVERLLIIGSGFSFHNMRAFFSADVDEVERQNKSFEDWLVETCSATQLNEYERRSRLDNWKQAPAARFCHPREEHLLPLHLCYGAAGRPCNEFMRLRILGRMSSMYLWSSEISG